MRLLEVGVVGQQKLRDAHVLLVGCGGLGAPAGLYLAAAGIGRISLADDDSVALTNLHRQIAYVEADIGAPKVDALARALRARNHEVVVCTHMQRVTEVSALLLGQGVDVVADATDNAAARYALSDACVALGVPLVHAAVHGFTGQVATLCLPVGAVGDAAAPANATRGCYRCVHPASPPAALVPLCDAEGVLGTTPGVLGVLLAQQVLLCLLQPPATSTLTILDLRAMRVQCTQVAARLGCIACGLQRTATASAYPPATTLAPTTTSGAQVAEQAAGHGLTAALAQLGAGAELWDVRSAAEWAEGNLAALGAIHVDASLIRGLIAAGQLPQRVVVYCEHGPRSRTAAATLVQAGVAATFLRGGIAALR